MASPGWYSDPEDAGQQQYFDGQQWTGERRPAFTPGLPGAPSTPSPEWGPTSTAALPEAESYTAQYPPAAYPPAAYLPQQHSTQQHPTQQYAPQHHADEQYPLQQSELQQYPAQQYPPLQSPVQQSPVQQSPVQPSAVRPYAAQYPQPQALTEQFPAQPYPAEQYPAQQYPAQQYPAQQSSPQSPPPQYPLLPQWAQPDEPHPPARRRSRKPLIITVVLLLVAGLGGGGYLLFRGGDSAKFTLDGKSIDKPEQALAQAASSVQALVESRHGASNNDTRCYYAVPSKPAKGAKRTDIDHSVWCGPVLFIDGKPSQEYLRFAVASTTASGKVSLTVSPKPTSDDPAAVPGGLSLKRPDGSTAPSGTGGLKVPKPPPAAANTLIAASLGAESVPTAPPSAVIGSINGGVTVTELGRVTRFGVGDDARSAPAGQRLIAFQVAGSLSESASVAVNGGSPRRLPGAGGDQYIVVAVPTAARSVDLVLTDGGYRQTISLLTGKPGRDNITVLARSHTDATATKSGTVTFAYSDELVFPDGTTGTSRTGTFTSNRAALTFSLPDKHVKASGPSKALLFFDIGYTMPGEPGKTFGFPPQTMTFTPSGGAPIKAKNVATQPDHIYDVFEVPGGLTTGTLTISGSYTSSFTNMAGTYTTTITTPITIPVSFPAG